jgi:ABC-type iron transport system FetAB permease component
VNDTENRLRNLSFRYADSVEKKVFNDATKSEYGNLFGNILADIVNLFQNTQIIPSESVTITDQMFSVDIAPDGLVGVTLKLRDDVTIKISLNEQVINRFADIISCEKDVDSLLDADVNTFLTTVLGFQ